MLTHGTASISSLAAANRCILEFSTISALMWQCGMDKHCLKLMCSQLLMDRGSVAMRPCSVHCVDNLGAIHNKTCSKIFKMCI